MVTLIDLHMPDVLLLTETPMIPHHGALAHVLRNMGYNIHYNPVNAPPPKGTLPEARLQIRATHNGERCWIAYNRHAPWASTVQTLPLPGNCPRATTCAIELTLHTRVKAVIIAC